MAADRQSWESHVDALSCFPVTKEAFRDGLRPAAQLPGAVRDAAWWQDYDIKVSQFCARAETALGNLPAQVGTVTLAGAAGDVKLALFVKLFRTKRGCFFTAPPNAGWKGHAVSTCATQVTTQPDMTAIWTGIVDRFEGSLSGTNSAHQRVSRQKKSEAVAEARRAAEETAAAAERAREERRRAEDAERAARIEREDRERRERDEREREERRREYAERMEREERDRRDRENRDREERKRDREDREERESRATMAQNTQMMLIISAFGARAPGVAEMPVPPLALPTPPSSVVAPHSFGGVKIPASALLQKPPGGK